MTERAQGYEVGAAYVSLYADTQGLSEDINEALGEVPEQAQAVGEQVGEELTEGSKRKTEGWGQKILAWGGFAVLGKAIGGMFKDGWDNATQQLDLERTMAANLGTSPEIAKRYAEEAADLYAMGWGQSLEEVGGDVQSILSEATDIYAEDLQTLYPLFKGIAEQSGEDVSRIVGTVSRMMGSDLVNSWEEGADVIAAAYQSFGEDSGEDVLDTLTEYSVQFQKLGLGVRTTLGMMQQGMHAGARSTDLVADALKEFAIRSIDGSKGTVEAYEAMGFSAEVMQQRLASGGQDATAAMQEVFDGLRDVGDAAQREAIAVALFGTQAEDLGAALYALDPSTATDGLGDLAGTAQEMADASLSLDDMLGSLGRTLSMSIADAIRPLLPMLREGIEGLRGFLGWFADNPVITTVLLGVASALALLAAGTWAVNAAMLANPVVLIVGAIIVAVGLLAAAIAWLVQNWSGVVTSFEDGWNRILSSLQPVLENTQFGIDTLVGAAKAGAESIGGFFGSMFSGIGQWGADTWAGLTDGIQKAVQYLVDLAVWATNEVDKLLGGAGSLSAPKIPGAKALPGMANGGTVTKAGLSWVGEDGPELLHFNPGATVIPHDASVELANAGSGSGSKVVNIINPVAEKGSRSLDRYRGNIGDDLSL